MADSKAVWILTKQATGISWDAKGRKKHLFIKKGELVIEIPKKEQVVLREGVHPHNYCLLRSPDVTLYDSGTGVQPLAGAEADYLEGVQDPISRSVEYRKEQRLKWIMGLRNGDMVYIKLMRDDQMRGKVRYYGSVEGRRGVMFGIGIMVMC